MSAYVYPDQYSSPRDRYYEALAQAEAAKADYEASVAREVEVARRREAFIMQDRLRRRDQARRAAFVDFDDDELYGYPPFGQHPRRPSHQSFYPYHHQQAYDPYSERQQFVERQREAQHARFIAQERARIQAEVEAAVEAKAKREADARAAQWKAKREQAIKVGTSRLRARHLKLIRSFQSQHRAARQQESVTFDQVLAQLFGQSTGTQRPLGNPTIEGPRRHCQRSSGCNPQACQCVCVCSLPAAQPSLTCATQSRAPAQVYCAKPAVVAPAPSKSSEKPEATESTLPPAPAAGSSSKATPAPHHPVASSSKAAAAPVPASLGSLKDVLSKRLGSEPESDVREVLQGLFGSIFSGQQGQGAPAPKPEGSMKEQLERRLHHDHDAEKRDIELAIAESLKHAPSSPSSSKGKAAASPAAPVVNTPAGSLAAINEIEGQFKTLSAAFEFPNKLDISPPSSPGFHSTSTLSRLAFTAANAPVRYYEQALSGLLSRLDAIESSGDDEVRHRRKEVVNAVETALEEVEREVETRAAMVTARDSTRSASVPIIAEPVAPKQVEAAASQEPIAEVPVVVVTEDLVDVSALPISEEAEDAVEGYLVTPIAAPVVALEEDDSSTATTPAYPPSVSDSIATITADATVEDQQPFLLAKSAPEAVKVPAHTDVDDEPVVIGDGAGSDWSEVEA